MLSAVGEAATMDVGARGSRRLPGDVTFKLLPREEQEQGSPGGRRSECAGRGRQELPGALEKWKPATRTWEGCAGEVGEDYPHAPWSPDTKRASAEAGAG